MGIVTVGVADGEWGLPARTLLHSGFGQVVLASLQVFHQGASSPWVVSREGFPVVRVHLKGFHIPLADVPESQLWSSSVSLSGC